MTTAKFGSFFEEFHESGAEGNVGILTVSLSLGSVLSSPFEKPYPVQKSGDKPVKGRAGELRGYYRRTDGSDRWKPSWSEFGHPRSGKTHFGLDIYAAVGTNIVAIADGYVQLYPTPGNDDLGIRAGLSFTGSDGVKYDLLYGHLSEVEGESRSVKKGDLIGRTGCTGNAEDGTCASGENVCKGHSSHVHIAVRERKSGAPYLDPLVLFGWTVAYIDDDRDVPCKDAFS